MYGGGELIVLPTRRYCCCNNKHLLARTTLMTYIGIAIITITETSIYNNKNIQTYRENRILQWAGGRLDTPCNISAVRVSRVVAPFAYCNHDNDNNVFRFVVAVVAAVTVTATVLRWRDVSVYIWFTMYCRCRVSGPDNYI